MAKFVIATLALGVLLVGCGSPAPKDDQAKAPAATEQPAGMKGGVGARGGISAVGVDADSRTGTQLGNK
jgi:hypothetical protein